MNIEVSCVKASEVKKTLKRIKHWQTGSADSLVIDLIKDAADFLTDKLAILFTKFLQTCFVPSTWKKASIILIHKKGDKDLTKNLCSISLLSVMYKHFTSAHKYNYCNAGFKPAEKKTMSVIQKLTTSTKSSSMKKLLTPWKLHQLRKHSGDIW